MLNLSSKSESFLYLSKSLYLVLNSLLAIYLMVFKGPELFGQYSLITIQIAFFTYIVLHGLPNILQFSISRNEKLNSYYFFPSFILLAFIPFIFNLDEFLKLEIFLLILIGSIFQALINIFSVAKYEYRINFIFTILANVWIIVVVIYDYYSKLSLSEIIQFWSLNSILTIVFTLSYLASRGLFSNFYFENNLKELMNILSNVLIGLPYELFRFLERNFFSASLSEVVFGIYSFLLYCVSSFQGVFVRPKNQILINQFKDKNSMRLIKSHQRSILYAYTLMLLPYLALLVFGMQYYESISTEYLFILIFPFLYNLFYNNASSFLIFINLFGTSPQKAKLCILLMVPQLILFLISNIINDFNLSAVLMLAYFMYFSWTTNFIYSSIKQNLMFDRDFRK